MISLVTFKSAVVQAGYRVLKVLGYGNSALTADECGPYGIDSNPVANLIAVYTETEEAGDRVLLGYMNRNQMAGQGETRLFSQRPDGSLSFYGWLKNDGTLELGGTAHNLVRFTPLQASLNDQNTQINAELEKISVAITALTGSYVPGTVQIDITDSKINEIKTI